MKKELIILCIAVVYVSTLFAQHPLSLSQQQCRQMALDYNEMLKKADNKVRQAELDKAVAFASYLPKFEGSLTGTYLFPDMDVMGSELQMRGMYMAGISLIQPVYSGGKIRTANKLAEIGEECAKEQLRKTRMDVIAEADKAYWTYVAVLEKVKMLDSYEKQMLALYDMASESVNAELSTENDLLRISAKRSEIQYQLQKVRNGADLCRISLCHVIGAGFDTMIEPVDTVLKINAPSEMSEDISSRPEFRLLQKQVDAGLQQVKLARADILPTIGLSAGYAYYGNVKLNGVAMDALGNAHPYTQKFDDGFGLAMASVSIPVFSWGAGLKKIKKARIEAENARLDMTHNVKLMNIEVRQAVQNVKDGYQLVQTATIGLQLAERNLQQMTQKYEVSMATLTDLLDAQSQWQTAKSNFIEAQTQYKIYETEYLKKTGKL